jgi:FAD/FMN-containing dehydrogenase
VCSNVYSYEIVLADGTITTASATVNADLWQALKGGSNNFGIVTRFTVRCFPSTKIWSGFLYMLPSQTNNVLSAFHEFLNRADSADPHTSFDKHAAGPLASFSYIQQLGFTLVAANLVYTKLPENPRNWPNCWNTFKFKSLWRIWSTCKVRTLTSATDELNSLNPSGRRQMFGTMTIKNDRVTIAAVHAIYKETIASLYPVKIKGLVWTLIFQPLLPEWVRKGDPNPLGLHDLTDEPLVVVSFAINWDEGRDDELIKERARRALEKMEAFAAANKTGHRWRSLNYCAEWQKPIESYGEENLRLLQEVSRKYDPNGLFQRGCVGGFKLNMPAL